MARPRSSVLRAAIEPMQIKVPTRGNRCLEGFLDAANADEQLKAWWHVAQVNATRLGMSVHSWIHIQIVTNIGLRLFRLLNRRGVEPDLVRIHGMRPVDAEVVIAAGCLLHDVGMSIHRAGHQEFSLFKAKGNLDEIQTQV
jgi:metal-dependent HD superfamily phosphatase/phosphodiesterase